MAKRGPQPKSGNMAPPAYTLCEHVPGPPATLHPRGRRVWDKCAAELFRRGVLTTVGLEALEMYCQLYARALVLNENVEKDGYTRLTAKGFAHANPEVTMATQHMKQALHLAEKFGFTPASQSRIAIVPEPVGENIDPIENARRQLQESARPN